MTRQLYCRGLLIVLLILITGQVLYAQNGLLTGKVYDEHEEVMPFAHVLLLQYQDSVMVKGVTTDTEGRFTVKEIPIGNYLLNISLLGYPTSSLYPLRNPKRFQRNYSIDYYEPTTTGRSGNGSKDPVRSRSAFRISRLKVALMIGSTISPSSA